MKKKIVVSVAILLAVLLIAGIVCLCVQVRCVNRISWILGKTSAEVAQRYGTFYEGSWPSTGECSFLVREQKSGFLNYSEELLFTIWFDANGVARKCYIEWGPEGG